MFATTEDKQIPGLPIVFCGGLYQIPLVRGYAVYNSKGVIQYITANHPSKFYCP